MKKFIVIFVLMLVTFVGNAQYINPNIRQDNTSPAQWNEWKGLMNQYNKSKGLIYGGLAVGAVGVTTFAILRNTNRSQMEVGSDIVNIGSGAATINRESLNTAYTIGMYSFGIGAVGSIIWGIIRKNDARHKLDRFYFNNGFIYTF